jgi:hypothetical protein
MNGDGIPDIEVANSNSTTVEYPAADTSVTTDH